MTSGELLQEIQDRISRHAKDGPYREIDLSQHSAKELQQFMSENPEADYYIPGDCELPVSAKVAVVDELGRPATTSEYFVAVDRISRHYGGAEEGGWWYDAGDPVDHRLILVEFSSDGPRIHSESMETLRLACVQWSAEYDFDTCHRGSMAPRGPDFGIRVGAGDVMEWSDYSPYC